MMVHSMKRLFFKLCSSVLIMSVILSITSCGKDLDSSKFFTNIVEASKVDGKLYQISVC